MRLSRAHAPQRRPQDFVGGPWRRQTERFRRMGEDADRVGLVVVLRLHAELTAAFLRQILERCALGPTLLTAYEIRSEEHTSELQSLMRISYAVFCLEKKKPKYYNFYYI